MKLLTTSIIVGLSVCLSAKADFIQIVPGSQLSFVPNVLDTNVVPTNSAGLYDASTFLKTNYNPITSTNSIPGINVTSAVAISMTATNFATGAMLTKLISQRVK